MTLVTNGFLTHVYEEKVHPEMRLGRHQELDARSLAYAVTAIREIKPAAWPAGIPTLNQGNLGSCTGNAGTRALAALYGSNLSKVTLHGQTLDPSDADTDERFAVELYHEATAIDKVPGVYPPTDTGSSGLAICKSLKNAGLISGYSHALSLRGVATMLQTGGAIMGSPWFEAWFEPDSDGFVDSGNWFSSGLAGGHEFYIEALEAWDDHDPAKCILLCHNSWGQSWGQSGRFRIRGTTYNQNRQQVDVKQFVR